MQNPIKFSISGVRTVKFQGKETKMPLFWGGLQDSHPTSGFSTCPTGTPMPMFESGLGLHPMWFFFLQTRSVSEVHGDHTPPLYTSDYLPGGTRRFSSHSCHPHLTKTLVAKPVLRRANCMMTEASPIFISVLYNRAKVPFWTQLCSVLKGA